MTTWATLTIPEVYGAAHVGLMRQVQSMQAGATPRNGARNHWQIHVEGALAERAFAKLIGAYWEGSVNAHHRPDVGAWEVRSRPVDHWDLILRENDRDDAMFVLLVGEYGRYRVVGTILGSEGKKFPLSDPTQGEREKAHFVPQSAMTPWPEGELRDAV